MVFFDHGNNEKLKLSSDYSIFYLDLTEMIVNFIRLDSRKKLALVLDSCKSANLFKLLESKLTENEIKNVSFLGHYKNSHNWKAKHEACPSMVGFLSLALVNSLSIMKKNKNYHEFEDCFRNQASSIFLLVKLKNK